MEKSLYQIFKTFFKVGTLLLGGGYVILPLLQSELVDKKHWIDDDTLCEYYALSQSVPGIIAANTAMFTGYKLRGTAGAFTATIGLVLPAFVSIIIIARILEQVVKMQFVQSIFWGVGIAVMILIYLAVKEMWRKSDRDLPRKSGNFHVSALSERQGGKFFGLYGEQYAERADRAERKP